MRRPSPRHHKPTASPAPGLRAVFERLTCRGASLSTRTIVLGTMILCTLLLVVAQWLPLPAFKPMKFISGYGVLDNRRLLLLWGVLISGVVLAPIVTGWMPNAGGRVAASSISRDARSSKSGWRFTVGWLLAPATLFFLFVGPGVAYRGLNGHELVHLGYLSEIDNGRLLNVETRVTYGPLLGYSIFAFMKAVSFTLYGFRLYWNVATAVFLFLLFLAARRYFITRTAFTLFVLYAVLYTPARYYLSDSRGINGGFWGWANVIRQGWAVPVVLWLAGPLARSASFRPRILAGTLFMAGVLYAQETVLPGFLAFAMLIALSGWDDPRRSLVREYLAAAAGGLAVLLVFLLPVVLRGGLAAFIEATIEIPRLYAQGGGNLPYPKLFETPLKIPNIAIYYFPPLTMLLLLAVHWNRLIRGDRDARIFLPLAVYAAVSYVNTLVRADVPHVLNVALVPILLVFLELDRFQVAAARHSQPETTPVEKQALRSLAVRWALPAAAILPLLASDPGLKDLASGIAGRLAHWQPLPPPGYEKIPLERAGIWTPAESWFDDPKWGEEDDVAAIRMIREVSGGQPTYFIGNKASLYYFLADAPCAAPYTDLSSQCLTPENRQYLDYRLRSAPPEYVFVLRGFVTPEPRNSPYRYIGFKNGVLIARRSDLEPVVLEGVSQTP
jgi:hypothetical protein